LPLTEIKPRFLGYPASSLEAALIVLSMVLIFEVAIAFSYVLCALRVLR